MCTRSELTFQIAHSLSTWRSHLLLNDLRECCHYSGLNDSIVTYEKSRDENLVLSFKLAALFGNSAGLKEVFSKKIKEDRKNEDGWVCQKQMKLEQCVTAYFFFFLSRKCVSNVESTVRQQWILLGSRTLCTWNHISCILFFFVIFQSQYWPVKSSCSCQYVECNAILVSNFFRCCY